MAEPLLAGPHGQPVGFQLCLPVPARFPGSGLFFSSDSGLLT